MEMRKILIANHGEDFTESVCEMLQGRYLVRGCGTGIQALELLRSYRPDVLVLDLMLPELDGISLLQRMAEEEITTNVLALTRQDSDYITSAMARYNVSYLMMKPCSLKALEGRIHDLAEQTRPGLLKQPDARSTVSNTLLSLRVPTKLRGYGCVREAVLCLMRDPEMSITKQLYPEVAKRCDGSAVQVERAIRGAIHAAWRNQDDVVWPRYFKPCADGTIPRPSNAAFLTRLADQLSLAQLGLEEEA